jgi:O-methyltransferase involved in polyketide biosynthesis
MPEEVQDSALIVNAYRAWRSKESGDPYAALWVTPARERWADQYAAQVGHSEILVHALRHHYFLGKLRAFLTNRPDSVLVNIGAGFTHYPYLLPAEVSCCELDTETTLCHKREKLAEWERTGRLPHRNIEFIAVTDLNDPRETDRLALRLDGWIARRPSFVLFEGVFFFLNRDAIRHWFEVLAALQVPSSQLACTSFRPEETEKAMFHRLVQYCHQDYRMRGFVPTTLPTAFYREQHGYALAECKDYFELAVSLRVRHELADRTEVLEEDVHILDRVF